MSTFRAHPELFLVLVLIALIGVGVALLAHGFRGAARELHP